MEKNVKCMNIKRLVAVRKPATSPFVNEPLEALLPTPMAGIEIPHSRPPLGGEGLYLIPVVLTQQPDHRH